MSEVIDTNVVEIKFDNSQFIENVSQTIDSVEMLKQSLQFDSHSFDSLSRQANSLDLSNIANNLDTLTQRFSGFGIAGMTAIQEITKSVMGLGSKLAGLIAKPWKQIISGGTSRATNIANAQFQLQGIFGKTEKGAAQLAMTMNADAEAIKTITGYTEDMVVAMDAANYAVADTAYGLDSAAKAASVLATSGVDVLNFQEDLKDANGMLRTEMQVALRSISGVAAMANSSYDDVAHVFERISGNGRVMAIDLQSLSARGLNAAATLRDYLNEIGETSNATEKDIRDMVSKGKIDFMTFAKAMDSAYGDHAKDANNTFEGAFSNMKFALSKIGADFIGPLREKMIPVLNDVRMAINSFRKALQFKVKFPFSDEEISIVELFTRVIGNLSNKIHDMFLMWTGGQNVLENAMTTIARFTDSGLGEIKKIFDDVKSGSVTSISAISTLTQKLSARGVDMSKVYQNLAESMDTTEESVREMCHNGEISLEQFSNAISATFGNTVLDDKVSHLAEVFKNVITIVYNLASGVSSVVGPVIEAFIRTFSGNGINGVISFTQAIADFTSKLRLSVPTQRSLVRIFQVIFGILKTGLKIVKSLTISIGKILLALSPLVEVGINFISVIAEIIAYVADAITQSEILNAVVTTLANTLTVLGKIIIGVIVYIIKSVAPAIRIVGAVFNYLNRAIRSVSTKSIRNITFSFSQLISAIGDLKFIRAISFALTVFAGAIGTFFTGIGYLFTHLDDIVKKVAEKVKSLGNNMIDCFKAIGEKIKETFLAVVDFIKSKVGTIAAVISAIESMLIFAVLYNLMKTGDMIRKVVNAWSNKQNASAFNDAVTGIKNIAIAFAILAGTAIALSLIPTEKINGILKLVWSIAGAIALVTVAFYGMKGLWAWMESKKDKPNPMITSLQQFLANLSWSIGNLAQSAANALTTVSQAFAKSMKMKAAAVLIISIAVSLLILAKAIMDWSKIPWREMGAGLAKMGIMLAVIIASVSFLAEEVGDAKTSLIGAAILMLALIAVLKGFIDVIKQYDDLELGFGGWVQVILKIAASLFIMAGAVALIGNYCKKSGFAMMAGAIDMLAFLVVLKHMKDIIEEYSEIGMGTLVASMFKMAVVLGVFVLALRGLSDVFKSEKSFSANFKGGINYDKTSQNIIGLILMIFSISLLLKTVASTIKTVAEGGFWGWLGQVILIFVTLESIADLVDSMDSAKVDWKSLAGVALMLAAISTIFGAMSLLDPFKIMTIAGGLALVMMSIGQSVEAISKFATKDKKLGTSPVKTILSFAALLASLAITFKYMSGMDAAGMAASAASIAVVLFTLAKSVGMIQNVKVNYAAVLEMVSIAVLLLGVIAILNQIEVKDPTGMLAMTVCISILALAMAGVVNLLDLVAGVDKSAMGAFAAIAGSLSVVLIAFAFAASIASGKESAFFGLTSCVSALSLVAVALMFLLTKINTNAKVWASYGLFAAILSAMTGFAALISKIAQIGDVSNTLTIMDGLVRTMYGLLPVIASIQLVISVFALLLQNPMVMLGAAVGLGLFVGIMAIIAGFAALIACIAKIGDPNNTIMIMEGVTEMMRSLSITLLMCVAIGALGLLAIAGLGIIETAVVSLLIICGIIGGFEKIQNAVMTGASLMILVSESIRTVTEIMSNISLEGISMFLIALEMLSDIDFGGLVRLGLVGSTLLVATLPIISIGKQKREIERGLDVIDDMMTRLVDAYTMSELLGDMDADSIIEAVKELEKVSDVMTKYASYYVVSGFSHGLIDGTAQALLRSGAVGMAAIAGEAFCDYLGIHSDSDWFIDKAHFSASGYGHGLVDAQSISSVVGGVTDLGTIMDSAGTEVFGNAGSNSATSWLTGFLETFGAGTGYISSAIDITSLTESTSFNTNGKKGGWYDVRRTAAERGKLTKPNNTLGNFQNEKEYQEWLKSQENAADDLNEAFDYGDLSDFIKELEGATTSLTSIDDLMSGMDSSGLTNSIGSSSKAVDELTSKIDNLMDKYEDLWDDAKERANRDLFKGVDKQGDDFLDSVQDIMDKFKNIYQDAVDKTNGEDLFAEVKDDEESFAPDTLLNNLEDQVNQVNELNTIISSLGGRIADNGLRAAISSMSVDDLPELRAMYRMDDSQLREYESLYKKKVQANQNKIQNELTGSLSQLTGQYTDVATYVATDYSTNALVHNLQSQIDQLNEYNNTVASLTGRIKDVNLREAIAHMGTDSLEELKALNRMTDAQLDEYTEMYRRKVDEEAQVIKTELSTELSTLLNEPVDISEFYLSYRGQLTDATNEIASEAGQAAGTTIGKATAKGAKSNEVLAVARNSSAKIVDEVAEGLTEEEGLNKIEANVKLILDNIKAFFEESNEDFKKFGITIVEKICAGIDLGRRGAGFTNTLNDLKLSIANAITVGYEVKWLMVGEYITNGIAKGMRDDRAVNNLTNTAKLVALKAAAAAREALLIKSPSRVFMEIGRFIDEGLAIGLRDYAGLAEDEAGSMAEGSVSAVQDAIQQLSGMLDGSIDLNPVITPTLDLSEINARSSALANMFTGRQIAVQARADDQQAEMMTQLGNILAEQNTEPRTITFNQTNNSPKALSRTEIYRQTRNGFSQLASAIQ